MRGSPALSWLFDLAVGAPAKWLAGAVKNCMNQSREFFTKEVLTPELKYVI
jgi:hypothetical protein